MVKPDFRLIFIGVIIVVIMYIIPFTANGTIAKNAEICTGNLSNLFFGCNYPLAVLFYVGWAFAIVFMAGGFFTKEGP